jgi:hypothetical protein
MGIISEKDFADKIREVLAKRTEFKAVTGPGRSGAIAAVYASYLLRIPFIPYGNPFPNGNILIIDTAINSGRTLRKATRKYGDNCYTLALYHEPPRIHFWYETI